MRIVSDFRLFERPPKPSLALVRWVAWRWCLLGVLVAAFIAVVAATYYIGGEPIHYTNENRDLTEGEVAKVLAFFLSIGGLFFLLGAIALAIVPKQ